MTFKGIFISIALLNTFIFSLYLSMVAGQIELSSLGNVCFLINGAIAVIFWTLAFKDAK